MLTGSRIPVDAVEIMLILRGIGSINRDVCVGPLRSLLLESIFGPAHLFLESLGIPGVSREPECTVVASLFSGRP